MLISQYNPSDPGKGTERLLDDRDNLPMLVKSTDAITASFVIKARKKRADKLTAMTSKTVLPSIAAQTEAAKEANQFNVINQLVISAKDGVVEAITKLVGSKVTNAILRTVNSSNYKSINEFTLYKVMKAAINGTDRPSTNNVLEQLIKVINHNFGFHKKVSINMELMQSNTAQMATYGIVIGIPQIKLKLLANKTATKSNYGRNFFLGHARQKLHVQPCTHDAALLQIIHKELRDADSVQVLKDTPAPGAGTVHLVAEPVSYLQMMMDGDTHSAYSKLEYDVNSNSNSSNKEHKPCGHYCKKSQYSKLRSGCGKQEKDKDDKPKKNT
jgi:hypothetical protein